MSFRWHRRQGTRRFSRHQQLLRQSGNICPEYPDGCSGIFCYNNCYGIQAVTDGTSETIAFSEGICGNDKYASYAGNGVVNCLANGCTAAQSTSE